MNSPTNSAEDPENTEFSPGVRRMQALVGQEAVGGGEKGYQFGG